MYVAENKLKSLPSQLGNFGQLQELDLSSCELEILPESLSQCKSLEKLWLSNNRWV